MIRRSLGRRLERLERRVAAGRGRRPRPATTRPAARRRNEWRCAVQQSAILLNCLPPEDFGPAFGRVLDAAEAAGAALAALPDSAALRAADAALLAVPSPEDPPDDFEAQIATAVRRYRNGRRLDRDRAAPAELLAWCLVRRERAGRRAAPEPPAPPPVPPPRTAMPCPAAAAPAIAAVTAPRPPAASPPPAPLPATMATPGARPCDAPGAAPCGLFCRLSGSGAACRLLRRRGLVLPPAGVAAALLQSGAGPAAAIAAIGS